ncbi:hypothetical protein [Blastococcus sp. SYSU DS0973]
MRVQNLFSCRPLLGADEVVLSLTTMPSRLDVVSLAIESIARGSIKPQRVILWLDEETATGRPLPSALKRLIGRGLEVRTCQDYGPHKKYYPYVASATDFRLPMVTIDDDVMYPRWFLRVLLSAAAERADSAYGTRAKHVLVGQGGLRSYSEWDLVRDGRTSFAHILTGVGGILYPSTLQEALRSAGDGFMTVCPRADDLWIHAHGVRAGVRFGLATGESVEYLGIPSSQDFALSHGNVAMAGNDIQAAAVYEEELVRLIAADLPLCGIHYPSGIAYS